MKSTKLETLVRECTGVCRDVIENVLDYAISFIATLTSKEEYPLHSLIALLTVSNAKAFDVET